MSYTDALNADVSGDIETAADRYEAALAGTEPPNLNLLLNLAVLYWQATDYGLSTAKHLSPAFVARAGVRFPTLLADAHRLFPLSSEVEFWRKYIRWADLGEALSVQTCQSLLTLDPAVLIPAMHIFAQTNGTDCRNQALELLRQCEQQPTARNRYVRSVITGVLKRSGGV